LEKRRAVVATQRKYTKKESTKLEPKKRPPKRTIEGEENRLIGLATELAAKQLEDGTATSQVITHFLRLGSTRERLEKQNLKKDLELKQAKITAIESTKKIEALYIEAIRAMKDYAGRPGDES
jgi:predicted transcriptional regulator